MDPRFLTLDQVGEELAVSRAQTYALVRSGDLPAIKLGGRGQWRVERAKLELYIQWQYADTARFVLEHPWPGERGAEEEDDDIRDTVCQRGPAPAQRYKVHDEAAAGAARPEPSHLTRSGRALMPMSGRGGAPHRAGRRASPREQLDAVSAQQDGVVVQPPGCRELDLAALAPRRCRCEAARKVRGPGSPRRASVRVILGTLGKAGV